MRTMRKKLAVATGVLIVIAGGFIAYAVYDHLAFGKMIIEANEKMKVLGGGVTNGRRSAEGVVMAWSHDPAFDAPKLQEAMTMLRALDGDNRVKAIRFDFRDSGIKDQDLGMLKGLSKLGSVDLSRTAVTQEGVTALLALYPGIQVNTNDFTGVANK